MPGQSFYLPTSLYQGIGCFSQLGVVAASYGTKALLVCGRRAMRAAGILERAVALLEAAGVASVVYDKVKPEPVLAFVEKGITLASAEGCDMTIGLGGGSAMDIAKAVAGLLPLPGSVAEYHAGRALEGPGLPFLAVPTTAGTGAEVTKNAVLTDPIRGVKKSIRREDWFARAALVDPELTLSVPPDVTASAGGDALCQAIEAYVSIGAMPVTDALCEDAIRRIGRSLVRAYEDGTDLAARADMLYGSLLAGMALANARLGAVHGIAHPLGQRYHIPHGVLCTLLLPHVMAYNVDYAGHKYARVASLLGMNVSGLSENAATAVAIEAVRELGARTGIPQHLRDVGVRRENWDDIIAQSLPSGSFKHNPRPLTGDDVQTILELAI